MYINLNAAAKSFFNILTGLGFTLSLYDQAGNDCLDSEKYRYAFIQQIGAMFSLIANSDDAYASISYSSFNYNDKFEELLLRLRTNAIKYGLGFRPISYEKKLQPRDFAFSAINNIQEEINMDMINEHGTLHGASLKRSYKDVGDCRIIIHHNRPISERRVGGRGLYIEKMFVENQEGERFSIKSKLLLGANALANHLNEGGDINDHVSKHILMLSEQYVDLRTVSRYIGANKKALRESAGSIKNAVDFRLNEMSNTFRRLSNPVTYSRVVTRIEPVALNEAELDETHFNNLLEQLGLDTDCEINAAVKTVARLISEQVINEARPLSIKSDGTGPDDDDAGEYDGSDMSKLAPPMNRHGMNWPRDPNHPYADRKNYFSDEPGQSAADAQAEWDRKVARHNRQWNRALDNPNHPDYKKIQARLDRFGIDREEFNHWAELIQTAYWIAPAPDKGVKEEFREAAIQLLSKRLLKAINPKMVKIPEDANFATRLAHLFHNVSFNVNNSTLSNFASRIADDLILSGRGGKPSQEKPEFFQVIAKIAEVTGIMKSGVSSEQFIKLLKNELYSGKYKNVATQKGEISKVYAGVEYEQNRELREWASQFESTRVLLESTVSDLELNHVKTILEQIAKKCNISDPKANVAQVVYKTINEYCNRKEFNTYLLETRFYQVYKKGLVEFVLNQENPLLTESEVWDMSNALVNNSDSDETFATVTSKLTAAQLEQIINALSCNWKIEIAKPAITKLEAIKTQALNDLGDFKKTEIQQDFEDQITV